MKRRLLLALAVTFALASGVVTVLTVHPQAAIADPDNNGGGGH